MIDSEDRISFRESYVAREQFIKHLESKLFSLDRHDPETNEFKQELKALKMQISWIEMDIKYLKDRMWSREFWAGHKAIDD